MRQIISLLVLMSSIAVQAATYTVGDCNGRTHADLKSAWDEAGTANGQHTIRLCPGIHTSPALNPNSRHAGITLTSVSGNAFDTELTAIGGTLFGLTYQTYNITNLTVHSNFTSEGPATFTGSVISGAISTDGRITIGQSTVNGDLNGRNGVTVTDTNLSGNITATNGRITIGQSTVIGDLNGSNGVTVTDTNLSGNIIATNGAIEITRGTLKGDIDTGGNRQPITLIGVNVTGDITTNGPIKITNGIIHGDISTNGENQPITLDGVTMTGGNITTGIGLITLTNSFLGNGSSRIQVVTDGEVKANKTTVWGDITAAKWNNNTIDLDAPSIVYGYCDPNPPGDKCQPNSGGDPGGGGDDGGTGGDCDVELQLSVADHIAGSSTTVVLSANILTGDSGCFDGDRTVDFYSGTVNPATPAPGESRAIRLGSTPIANTSPGTALTVNFSDNTANLSLLYPDAGLMRLHACHENSCSYEEFVARPAGFTLAVPDNPGTVAADGPVFTAAGADFQVLVTAIGANGERLPNFGRELPPATVQLQTSLRAPVGGENPGLAGGFGGFGLNCAGDSATWGTACGTFRWPEVGAITITPRIADGNYLNGPDIVGPNSVDIGRFIPDHFTLDEAAIEHRSALACSPASDFTYLGEDLRANFKLRAHALDGSLTRNYTGNFARLLASALNPAAVYNGKNLSQQAAQTNWLLGTGDIKLTLQMKRTTSGPNATPVGPWYALQLGLRPVDADGVALKNTQLTLNVDGILYGPLGEADLRFGRLLLDNALGSELGPLQLPATAQYWNGSTWVNNTADSCTRLSLTTQVQLNGNLSGTTTVPVGSGSSQITSGDLQLNEGRGFIDFSAPNAVGYIDVELLLDAGGPGYSFLQDHLDADGNYDQNPRGRASWGLYRGNNSTILMLEAQP